MEALLPYLISNVISWRVVVGCLVSVPVTHGIGIHLHLSKLGTDKFKYLLYPFRGGNRHIVFQLLSWVLWCFAALLIMPVSLSMLPGSYLLPRDIPTFPHSHVDVVSGAAAVVAFIGEFFMIKAVLVYEGSVAEAAAPAAVQPVKQRHLQPHPVVASAVVVVLGLVLTVTGFLLLCALEYMPDIPSRVLYCCLSLSCLLIASSTTYGLGGFLRYGQGGRSSQGSSTGSGLDGMWQFFQPFSGGTAFVTTQAISWSLFAGTVVLLVALMQQLVAGVAHCFRCWALGAGTLMIAAQVMLALSLLFFRGSTGAAAQLMRAASGALARSSSSSSDAAAGGRDSQQSWWNACLPVLLMYCPVHCFFTLWTLSFVFMPLRAAVACWVAFLVPYYTLTQWGNPAHTGCRQWGWLMRWFERNVEGSLSTWFGSITVVYDGDPLAKAAAAATAAGPRNVGAALLGAADGALAATAAGLQDEQCQQLSSMSSAAGPDEDEQQQRRQRQQRHHSDASEGHDCRDEQQQGRQHQGRQQQQYIFGFQPHALYPTGAGFLPWMRSFRRHFADHPPVTLAASVIFFPPFIRDICCWAGFRQVSKPTFLAALAERGAVMFCPGGQAEMVHAWKAFLPPDERQVVLHTRHKGFCRIAVEHQAALVPVLALGENLQLRNLFNLPALQQYTYKRLGLPVPFILCGRWAVTPFPRRVPLLYVVGQPLQPPEHSPGQPVDPSKVDDLHRQYYASLVDLFERYKQLHPEFRQASIVLTDD